MPGVLFQPCRIGKLELRNRFVRSATWDGSAGADGSVTDASVNIYRNLARGGVGLIVCAYSYVSPHGKAANGQYGVYSNDMIPGLRRMTAAVHENGAKIALQIVHAGANSFYLPEKGIPLMAVSHIADGKAANHELTEEDIESIINDFAAAAIRAREAGFDAVQLHAAHRYLISQFLSPMYNRRNDKWGGSPERRRTFHIEVTKRIRKAIGPDFPLFTKLGVQDLKEGGTVLPEGVATAQEMVKAGVEAVEVSTGIGNSSPALKDGEGERIFFRDWAAAVKKAVSVPVILVGGVRSLAMAENIVKSGDADFISICRPFIREPGLIGRWQRGDTSPAKCISCNKCFGIAMAGEPIRCFHDGGVKPA